MIYVHSDVTEQYIFEDIADALNWIEKLLEGNDDTVITVQVKATEE